MIATLTELHGRSSEVARRMVDDARMLAELQRETSAVLLKLWNLRSELHAPRASGVSVWIRDVSAVDTAEYWA